MEFDVIKNRLILDDGDLGRFPRGFDITPEITVAEAVELVFRLDERRSEIDHLAQEAYFGGHVDLTTAKKSEMTKLEVLSADISRVIDSELTREFDAVTVDDFGGSK